MPVDRTQEPGVQTEVGTNKAPHKEPRTHQQKAPQGQRGRKGGNWFLRTQTQSCEPDVSQAPIS